MDHLRRVLVVAPHPDDEVLGVGGTISRLADGGAEVHVAIVTSPDECEVDGELVAAIVRESERAHEALSVFRTYRLGFPAARLDQVPHRKINERLVELVERIEPDAVFLPFLGDIHADHQEVFVSAMVACRPNRTRYPRALFAYETVSETNWNAPFVTPGFLPNVYVNISEHLDAKLRAMQEYQSQLRPFPNERSLEVLRALATVRGGAVGVRAAEAFVLLRLVF